MKTLLVGLLLLAAEGARREPPALSQPQIARIQALIRVTKSRDENLRTALDKRQQELTEAYADFELDQSRVDALHEEILVLQRQLLGNYHDLQVELRNTVGEQRFMRLKRRIDLYLNSKKKRTDGSSNVNSEQ